MDDDGNVPVRIVQYVHDRNVDPNNHGIFVRQGTERFDTRSRAILQAAIRGWKLYELKAGPDERLPLFLTMLDVKEATEV